jgi:hypothetical protein
VGFPFAVVTDEAGAERGVKHHFPFLGFFGFGG